MTYQFITGKQARVFSLGLTFLALLTTTALAQLVMTPKAVQLGAERAKLDAKRAVAYEMGVNIGFGRYQAEVTQTEFANKNSKIYGPAMNLRSAAFGKAKAAAESINAVISSASDKLDISQFDQYSDGFSHEKDALQVAKNIELKIEMKLKAINSNLFEAFILGYANGVAEANASGGESRRTYVSSFLGLSNEYAKKMNIYNQVGGTLVKFADGKVPMSEIYPKVVSLRQWYSTVVADLK